MFRVYFGEMKFPVPKTLIGAYSPIILLNWALGIGVIQYPIGRPRRIISAFWALVNFMSYLGFVVMANFPEFVEIQEFKSAASNYRQNAYFCVGFVAVSLCLGQAKSKFLKVCHSKIIFMNHRLQILGIPNDYDELFKGQILQLCAGCAAILTIVVLDFKFSVFNFHSKISRLGFYMTYHYLLIFSFVIHCSVTSSIRYFGNRFRRLNELLIKSDTLERRKPAVTKKSQRQIPRYSSVINEIYQNHSSSIRAAEKQSLLYLVRETRRIHRILCKTAMDINQVFGIQILFSVALSFGLITSILYTSYTSMATTLSSDPGFEDWIVYIVALAWIAFYAIKVLLVVQSCEKTSHEANRTRGLIGKLLEISACDEDIRDEIDIFSLQLIQNPMSFTASGFFTLDYAFISGMIGSVTTYLVIMIQMQSIIEPKIVNSTLNSAVFIARLNDTN